MRIFSLKQKQILFLISMLFITALVFIFPKIPQNPDYHKFSDNRTLLPFIPNTLDTLSNFPFLCVGIVGIFYLLRKKNQPSIHQNTKLYYYVFSFSLILTAIGSSYYHLHPNTDALYWDRLPMSIGFMTLLSLMIADRISEKLGSILLMPMVLIGTQSVWYWKLSELKNEGDLRAYLLVQFGSLISILLLMIFFPQKNLSNKSISHALGWYVLAKVFEALDSPIYSLTQQTISGHTLKHLAAAVGCGYVIQTIFIKPQKTI